MPQAEKDSNHKKWLGRKGLQFLESLMQMEKERCSTMKCLFATSNNKFKPQYNENTKSLPFCKLGRKTNKNAEEWKGRHRLAAVECNYKEID